MCSPINWCAARNAEATRLSSCGGRDACPWMAAHTPDGDIATNGPKHRISVTANTINPLIASRPPWLRQT